MREMHFAAAVLVAVTHTAAFADTVVVKYRGAVDLKPFQCESVDRSSLVTRLCYDARNRYVIVGLQGAYYHYCDVPSGVVASWRAASSMGRYFNENVKGRFDCRVTPPPAYR